MSSFKILEDEKLIFSVDMFNEGLDIPSIDMVMLLRPTQSPTVFLQQLGRGLRRYKGKNILMVKEILGHRPSRVEFFNNIDDEIYLNIKKTKSSLNLFNDYLSFLKENGELFESD